MSQEDLQRFFSELHPVSLSLRQVLYEAGSPLEHVYFIEVGVASVLTNMVDGSTIEVGMIGAEGLVGVSALLGGEAAAQQVIVQVPGTALRMSAALCKAAFDQSEAVRASPKPSSISARKRRLATDFTRSSSGALGGCSWPSTALNRIGCPHARVPRLNAWCTACGGHQYRRRAPAFRLDSLSSRSALDRRSRRARSECLRVLPHRSRSSCPDALTTAYTRSGRPKIFRFVRRRTDR